MYIWKTKSLAKEIQESSLTEADEKNYYIGLALIGVLYSFSGGADGGASFDILWLVKWLLMAVASIIGFNIAFRVNGAAEGNRFLSKVIPLSFPISIKLFLLGFAFGFFSAIFADMAGLPLPTNNRYLMLAFSLFIELLFFWRLCVHLRNCRVPGWQVRPV